eukprot:NODE_535_length_7046_cov_0.230747.p1 type:complete len:566 gc:universal NODE_535_length_7046_cov_0.230747:6721-5024(-)
MNDNDLTKLLNMDIDDNMVPDEDLLKDFELLQQERDLSGDVEDDKKDSEFILEEEVEIENKLPHEKDELLIALEIKSKEELTILLEEYKANAIQQKKLGATEMAVSYMKGFKLIQLKIKELEPLVLANESESERKDKIVVKPNQITVEPIIDKSVIKSLHRQVEISSLYAKIFLKLNNKAMAIYFHRLNKLSKAALDKYPVKTSPSPVEWIEPSYNPFVPSNCVQVEISSIDGILIPSDDANSEIFVLVDMGASTDKPQHFTHESVVKSNACSKKYKIHARIEFNEIFNFHVGTKVRKPMNIAIYKESPFRLLDYFTGPRVSKIGKLTINLNQALTGFEWSSVVQVLDGRTPTNIHIKLTVRTFKLLNSPEKVKKSEVWYFEDESITLPSSKVVKPSVAVPSPVAHAPQPAKIVADNAEKAKKAEQTKPVETLLNAQTESPNSSKATIDSPVGSDETDPYLILFNPDFMTSNLVFMHYLEFWANDPEKAEERQEIELKMNMLGIKVSSNQLSMQSYQILLKKRFEVIKKLAITLKNENNLVLAKEALVQIKKIQQEMDEIKEMLK